MTTKTKTMTKDYYTALQERRSFYGISKETIVSDERIQEVVQYAVKHTPSAFNSQSARVVVFRVLSTRMSLPVGF